MTWIVPIIVAAALVVAAVVGLVFPVLFLVRHIGGSTGGWRWLTEIHA